MFLPICVLSVIDWHQSVEKYHQLFATDVLNNEESHIVMYSVFLIYIRSCRGQKDPQS